MLVCAHGDVTDFCKAREWHICDNWNGEILEYDGLCPVLVTDADISEMEYYFLKGEMLGKGYMLISTKYTDDKLMTDYLIYANNRRKGKYLGRQPFSDEKVIQRILELRDAGMTLRAIRDAEGVHHSNGKKLSISTIQKIINNKKKEN